MPSMKRGVLVSSMTGRIKFIGLTSTSTITPSLVGSPRGGLLLPTAYTCPSNAHAKQMSRLATIVRFVFPGSFSSNGIASTQTRLSSTVPVWDATMETLSHRCFRVGVKREVVVPHVKVGANRDDE